MCLCVIVVSLFRGVKVSVVQCDNHPETTTTPSKSGAGASAARCSAGIIAPLFVYIVKSRFFLNR